MKKLIRVVLTAIFIVSPYLLIAQQESIDLEMIYKIKQEGIINSDIDELSFWMTDYLGPRLTASNGKKRADEWVSNRLKEYELKNVRVEEATSFGRGGWENQKSYVAMTKPYYTAFACNPKAWTGSTNGLVKGSAVLLDVESEEDFDKYKGQLEGKIVVMPSDLEYEVSYEPLASRYSDEELVNLSHTTLSQGRRNWNFDIEAYRRRMMIQRQAAEFIKEEGVVAVLTGSGYFNVPRSSGERYTSGEEEPIPDIYLPMEAHSRIIRLLQHDVEVELEMDIKNSFYESPSVTNVIGEIPGTDPKLKDEVVLIGGHLDSWHGGTGAADNASGCIVMMEAIRILNSLDIKPKRTIRIALWGGEEQGLFGSSGYVEKYIRNSDGKILDGFDNFAAYFNMDNGTGKFRGIYTQQNEMVKPIFEAWLAPFEDVGCSTITSRNTGSTDHVSFDNLGLPAFQFIQDEIEYGRGYHTVMDTYERLLTDDLRHNAIVVAAMVYHAAMRDEVLPRKPEVQSRNAAGERPTF